MSRSRRRVLAIAAFCIALASPGWSPAARPEAPRPADWVARGEGAPPAVSELNRGIRSGSMTFRELLEIRAKIMASSPLEGGSEMVSPATLRGSAIASEHEDPSDEITYLIPIDAGDLDGDGKDDVLALDWSWVPDEAGGEEALDLSIHQAAAFHDEGGPLRALSGIDGSELWRLQLDYYDAFRLTDVDGDGDIELLVNRVTYEYDVVYRLRQRIDVIDGASGASTWTWNLDGEVHVAGTEGVVYLGPSGISYGAIVVGFRDVLLSAQAMTDATGDGKGDVFAGSLDVVDSLIYAGGFGAASSAAAFTATALDGTSGAEAGSLTAVSIASLPWGAPALDLNADELADVLLSEGREVTSLRAVSFDGTELWRAVANPGIPSTPGDLSGDGKADVVVREIEETPWYSFEIAIAVHDGSDGTRLWEADTYEHYIVELTGSVDGGGLDVFTAGWFWDEQLEREGLRFEVWNGATGAPLWSREILAPDQDAWLLLCGCPDDITGDGRIDGLMAVERYDVDLDQWILEVRAVNGADGSDVWSASVTSYDELPIPLGADADGDGAGDLIWFAWSYDEDTGSESITAFLARGLDRAPLWSATITSPGWIWLNSLLGADLVGSDAAELVVGVEFYDPDTGDFVGPAQVYDAGGLVWST